MKKLDPTGKEVNAFMEAMGHPSRFQTGDDIRNILGLVIQAALARVDALTSEINNVRKDYIELLRENQTLICNLVDEAASVDALTNERDVVVDMLRECRAQRDAALARGQKENL